MEGPNLTRGKTPVEESTVMLDVVGTLSQAPMSADKDANKHAGSTDPKPVGGLRVNRRKMLVIGAFGLLALLVACGVAVVLALTGVLNFGGDRELTDAGQPWVYGKSQFGGANFSSDIQFSNPWSEWFASKGNISAQMNALLAGELGPPELMVPPTVQHHEGRQQGGTTVVVLEQNATLLDFKTFHMKNTTTTGDAPGMVTVNADYDNYVIFENLGCHGGTYEKRNAKSPSHCGDWCDDRRDCGAWTFARSSGVCYFKKKCPELSSEDQDVTGIKRDRDGEVTVRIDGGGKQTFSEDEDVVSEGAAQSGDGSEDEESERSDEGPSFEISDSEATFSTWILFQNLGCHGGTYEKKSADRPSQCSDWCAPKRECHAWTFATSSGVCYFKKSCPELTTEDQDVSGIKRDSDGEVTVKINGGGKETYSSEDVLVTPDDDDTNVSSDDGSDDEDSSDEEDSGNHPQQSSDGSGDSEPPSSDEDESSEPPSDENSEDASDDSDDDSVSFKEYPNNVCANVAGELEYNYNSGTIFQRYKDRMSLSNCQKRCAENSQCAAYSWLKEHSGGVCHLRKACAFLLPTFDGSSTGVKTSAQQPIVLPPDTDQYSYVNGQGCKDRSAQTIRGVSVERCQSLCSNDRFCRAFTYNRNRNDCFIKESCNDLQPSSADISGIKTGNGGQQPLPPGNGGGGLSSCNSAGCLDTQGWLEAHNARREFYHNEAGLSFVPLKWSPALSRMAQEYAVELVEDNNCELDHCVDRYGGFDRCQFGENLAWQSAGVWNGDSVLSRWTEDELEYLGVSFRGGHASQVLWRSTNYVGCGQAEGLCGKVQVCRYIKPGNCDSYAFWVSDFSACGPECPPEGCF